MLKAGRAGVNNIDKIDNIKGFAKNIDKIDDKIKIETIHKKIGTKYDDSLDITNDIKKKMEESSDPWKNTHTETKDVSEEMLQLKKSMERAESLKKSREAGNLLEAFEATFSKKK